MNGLSLSIQFWIIENNVSVIKAKNYVFTYTYLVVRFRQFLFRHLISKTVIFFVRLKKNVSSQSQSSVKNRIT